MADAPIGVLGDGWAVLAVADAIAARLPHEDVLVLADSAYAPWGERDPRRVRLRVDELTRDLAARGPKLLVLASAVAASDAANAFATAAGDVPALVLDVGLRDASLLADERPIAVVVTTAGVRPRPFGELLRGVRLGSGVTVVTWTGVREALDAGRDPGPAVAAAVGALARSGIGAVVLADPAAARVRTHVEAALAGSGIGVADCASATATRVWTHLRRTGLVAHRRRAGRRLLVSSDPVKGAAGLPGGGPSWRGGVSV